MTQEVSRRSVTAEARARFQFTPCRFAVRRVAVEVVFLRAARIPVSITAHEFVFR